MTQVKLSVSVKDDHLLKFEKVAEELKKNGMTIDSELKSIGVITGSADEDKISKLNEIIGVSDIEKQETSYIQ